MKNKKIIFSIVVAIALIVTMICSVMKINPFRHKASNPDPKTIIAEVEDKRIKELLPPGYQGPLIELNFRDDKGNRVSARKVLILPVSDQSAGGSGWSLDSSTNDIKGANCLRTALIDGTISGRGLRANTEYYAQREEQSVRLYTPQEAAAFSFHTPKYDASTRLHEIDVTLHEPNKLLNQVHVKEKPKFKLKGNVGNWGLSANEPLAMVYLLGKPDSNGRRKNVNSMLHDSKITPSFEISVDELGGDLLIMDADMRVLYAFTEDIKAEELTKFNVLKDHKNYALMRKTGDAGEMVIFYLPGNDRVPVACAVFPPAALRTEVRIPQGKYEYRRAKLDDLAIASKPLKSIELTDANQVILP